MQKSDLTSATTGSHCQMHVGRGGVLGILKCPLQNGCTTGTYTLGAGGGSVPMVQCSASSRVA